MLNDHDILCSGKYIIHIFEYILYISGFQPWGKIGFAEGYKLDILLLLFFI
jgi:hypothetical protein